MYSDRLSESAGLPIRPISVAVKERLDRMPTGADSRYPGVNTLATYIIDMTGSVNSANTITISENLNIAFIYEIVKDRASHNNTNSSQGKDYYYNNGFYKN